MAADDWLALDSDSIYELMVVERPSGTHLGPSSDLDGMRPLARDDESNAITTLVRLHPLQGDGGSEEGLSVRSAVIGGAVVLGAVGAVVVGRKLAPRARGAWDRRAAPALRSAWAKATGSDSKLDQPLQESNVLAPTVVDVVDAAAIEMSSDEARQRLAAALLARAFSDRQLRLLRDARIIDGDDPAELERVLQSLTAEQLSKASDLLIENGSLADLRLLLGSALGQLQPESLPRFREHELP